VSAAGTTREAPSRIRTFLLTSRDALRRDLAMLAILPRHILREPASKAPYLVGTERKHRYRSDSSMLRSRLGRTINAHGRATPEKAHRVQLTKVSRRVPEGRAPNRRRESNDTQDTGDHTHRPSTYCANEGGFAPSQRFGRDSFPPRSKGEWAAAAGRRFGTGVTAKPAVASTEGLASGRGLK
jgi:hypothetical protein